MKSVGILLAVSIVLGRPLDLSAQSAILKPNGEPLPTLHLMFSSRDLESSPNELTGFVRVGPQGATLFESDKSVSLRLTLLDSTGRVITRMGRTGSGPGEVRIPVPVSVTAGHVVVWDVAQLRFTEWSLDGHLIRTDVITKPAAPALETAHGMLAIVLDSGRTHPVVIQPQTGSITPLVDPAEPFFQSQFVQHSGTGPAYAPTLGQWSGGFLLGNPASYQVGIYTWDGKLQRTLSGSIAPIELSKQRANTAYEKTKRMLTARGPISESQLSDIRNRIAKTLLPAFTPANPIGEDVSQRIWVLGIVGDSAFADVFSNRGYLGRLGIACPGFEGRWSLSGRWLVLLCQSDDKDYAGDVVVRLFRIDMKGS